MVQAVERAVLGFLLWLWLHLTSPGSQPPQPPPPPPNPIQLSPDTGQENVLVVWGLRVLMAVASAIGSWEKSSESVRFRHWLRRVTRGAIR